MNASFSSIERGVTKLEYPLVIIQQNRNPLSFWSSTYALTIGVVSTCNNVNNQCQTKAQQGGIYFFDYEFCFITWLRPRPVLVWYIGECMVIIININNGIKEPTCGYKNCTTNPLLMFGGYVYFLFFAQIENTIAKRARNTTNWIWWVCLGETIFIYHSKPY